MDYLSLVLCLALAWVVVHRFSTAKKNSESNMGKLPPGPPTLPIFGNLFSLGTKPHISLTELAKKYGPLMMLQLGQVPTVIISSPTMAKEALQKNDLSFANRHIIDVLRAHNHHAYSLAWLPAGSQWRFLRKICNSHIFSSRKLDAGQNLRRNKVKDLLSCIENSRREGLAVNIGQAAFTTSFNVLLSTIFSVDLGDPKSEFSYELRNTLREMLDEMGKPNLADYFPILQKIDPQGVRRRTSVFLGKVIDLFTVMIDQRLEGKRPSDSVQGTDVLDALLAKSHEEKEEIIEPSKIPFLLLDLFSAGTETTSITVEWAMAELLENPEKLRKAQRELQEVIGKGNPVEEHDIPKLLYLQAVIKETLRLHPPVPLLVPRKVDTDVKLFDFTVPKNSPVFTNVWAMGRDPTLWENPLSFMPERFLGLEIDFKGHDFELIPFGAGRRICPGLPLASRMIPLMVGSLIHEYDWMLEGGVLPGKMDMEEKFGMTLQKAKRLCVIPVRG